MKTKLTSFEIARQTLMQLSKNQSPPNPENFRKVYDEIAGIETPDNATTLLRSLEKVLIGMGKSKPKCVTATQKISASLKKQDLINLENQLRQLISTERDHHESVNWGTLLRYMLRQLEAHHAELPFDKKTEDLNRIILNDSQDTDQIAKKIKILITSWGEGLNVSGATAVNSNQIVNVLEEAPAIQKTQSAQIHPETDNSSSDATKWRDMLINTINIAVLPQFAENPMAASRIESLIKQAQASNEFNVDEFNEALKSTLLRAELLKDSQHRMHESLIKMLGLLFTSIDAQADENKWLIGQINIVKEVISAPLDYESIRSAETSIRALMTQQSSIKPGLVEAKDTIKSMMNVFVNGLVEITESTGSYQTKISEYQQKISASTDFVQLNTILQDLIGDINHMNANAKKSYSDFQDTQKKIEDAEKHINELTVKLDYISQVAQQDFLTGALNRRGMNEAIEREFDRADRHNTPLSLAIIDIDHFKKINDTMGHSTGDVALAHLAKVVKSIIRSTDVLARYGGEEFVILLPGSKEKDAVNVIANVQRNLTKNFFMHDSNRVLITFSAGVAERKNGELFDEVLPRADAALYVAKQTGRNRVVGASANHVL